MSPVEANEVEAGDAPIRVAKNSPAQLQQAQVQLRALLGYGPLLEELLVPESRRGRRQVRTRNGPAI